MSLQDHVFILPVLRNLPESSRKENIYQEESVGLLPPHTSDLSFSLMQKEK